MKTTTRLSNPNADFDHLMATYRDQPVDDVRAKVIELWPHTSWPALTNRYDDLLELFRWLWWTTDDPDVHTHEELTIYRAESDLPNDAVSYTAPGLLWTTDLDTAVLFAAEYSVESDAVILIATAPRRAVLARFTSYSEVVVDPDLLRDVAVFTTCPRLVAPFG